MMRFTLVLALIVGCLLPSARLRAQEVRAPFSMDKQYSADVTVTTKDGMTIESKTYLDGEKVRSEMDLNGAKMATIVRKDKLKIYQVMPAQKMIVEMDYDEARFKDSAAAFGPDGKFELIGPETLNGTACTKYKVTSDKTHRVVFFWLDTVNKVPLKMEAQDRSFSVLWRHYKAGPQDPNLFEVPSGYQVMEMPAMPGAPAPAAPGDSAAPSGQGTPGASP